MNTRTHTLLAVRRRGGGHSAIRAALVREDGALVDGLVTICARNTTCFVALQYTAFSLGAVHVDSAGRQVQCKRARYRCTDEN